MLFLSKQPYAPVESFRDGRFGDPEDPLVIGTVEAIDGIFDLNRIKSTSWWQADPSNTGASNRGHAAIAAAREWSANDGCATSYDSNKPIRHGCTIPDISHSGRGPFFVYDVQEGGVVKAYRPRGKGDNRAPKNTILRLGSNYNAGTYIGGAANYKWAYSVLNEPIVEPVVESQPPAQSEPVSSETWGPPKSLTDLPEVGPTPKGCYWKASGNSSECTMPDRKQYNQWIVSERNIPKMQSQLGCQHRAVDVAKYCRGNPIDFAPIENEDYEVYFN